MNHTGWTNWTHKAWLACSAAVLLAAVATLPARAAEQGVPRGVGVTVPAAAARVIVKFKSGASVLSRSSILSAGSAAAAQAGPQAAYTLARRLGIASLADGRIMNERMQIMTSTAMGSEALAAKLAADSEVEWAVVDGRRRALTAPNDPLYPTGQTTNSLTAGQWYLHTPDSTVKSAINAEAAWNVTMGSSSIVVAVLDTGIRPDHPDLTAKILPGYDFISDSATGNDGNGRDSDPSDPGDWVTSAEDASGTFKGCGAEASSWHGTQTAGLVGASANNGIGMAGTAPNVMLLPVRVLGKCGGYDSDIIDAMRWAAGLSVTGVPTNTHPAKVLNMSLGSAGTCDAAYVEVIAEVTAAGASIVVAAGNDGLAVGVPANCSGVIAVAGLRHAGTKSGFSDLGPEVAISAPAGNCVNASGPCLYSMLSSTNAGTQGPGTNTYTDATNYALGTSFSAPLVAGTAALMLSAKPSMTPADIRSTIRSTATTFPSSGAGTGVSACLAPSSTAQTECYCTTSTCGAGMLNAAAAVNAAVAAVLPTPVISASATAVQPGTAVTLDASGSTASAGRSITGYSWSVVSGDTLIGDVSDTSAATFGFTAQTAGTVTVSLTVTDSASASASTQQSVQILSGLPTARISLSDTAPQVGDLLTLDSANSSALDGASIVGYQWELVSGDTLASFSGATNGATAAMNLTGAGIVTVRLTVTDSRGYTGSTDLSFTVAAVSSSGGGGGGGGAGSPIWAALLLLIGLALPRRRTRG